MIKYETRTVKIIRRASKMVDNSAVKIEATIGRLPPLKKARKITLYPTSAADLEPTVQTLTEVE